MHLAEVPVSLPDKGKMADKETEGEGDEKDSLKGWGLREEVLWHRWRQGDGPTNHGVY